MYLVFHHFGPVIHPHPEGEGHSLISSRSSHRGDWRRELPQDLGEDDTKPDAYGVVKEGMIGLDKPGVFGKVVKGFGERPERRDGSESWV